MKTIIHYFIICVIFTCGSSCVHAQNDIADNQAIQMLKEFYTSYNIAWSIHAAPDVLVKRLDSLQKKYCTIKLRNELKEEFKQDGLDHDLLINDEYTDIEHLKTLTITKDKTKVNAYVVSYVVHTTRAYKPVDQKVIIHLTIAKEGDGFKIASVSF